MRKRQLLPLAMILAILPAAAGCGGQNLAAQDDTGTQTPEQLRAEAIDSLRDDRPTLSGYQNAILQLNQYVDLTGDSKEAIASSPEEMAFFKNEIFWDDPNRRLAEIDGKSFTALDMHHLDASFLFRDAARALRDDLGRPPEASSPAYADYQLELARHAFDWTMRQVQLQSKVRSNDDPRARETLRRFRVLGKPLQVAIGGDHWPAHEILRRGTGDGEERLRVLLALFQQLRIPAVAVERKVPVVDEGRTEQRGRPWALGVVIGKEVYCFEPVLGVAIPGPGGKGVATLRQLKQSPELLQAIYKELEKQPDLLETFRQCQYDPGDPFQATATQLAQASLLIPAELSALSPRMRALQGWLDESNNQVVLHQSLQAARDALRGAGLDAEVRIWTSRALAGYPTVIHARFLENPDNEIRKAAMLVPRGVLIPQWYLDMEQTVGPQRAGRMYRTFDNLILSVRVQPLNEHEIKYQEAVAAPGGQQRLQQRSRLVRSGGVRDLIIRGRPEEAVDRILEIERALDKALDAMRQMPDMVVADLQTKWAPGVMAMEQSLNELILQHQKLAPNSPEAMSLEAQISQLAQSLEGAWRDRAVGLSFFAHQWASPEMREHLTYFMGLAKLELAVRAERRAARQPSAASGAELLSVSERWASAGDWFERYQAQILPRSRNNWGPASVRLLAACRAAEARNAAAASTPPAQ